MNEVEILEECADKLIEVQKIMKSLQSKDEEWNKQSRYLIDEICSMITI